MRAKAAETWQALPRGSRDAGVGNVLKVIGLVLLGLAAAAAWIVVPIASTNGGGSWCDRAHRYEANQRLTHHGSPPWSTDMRVGLSGCGSIGPHLPSSGR